MDRRAHWEQIYATQPPDEVSWYEPHPDTSIELITRANPALDARLIDVGGGASVLIDALLERGYTHLSVLDVSHKALERAKSRLGARAERVTWIVGDVTTVALPARSFDIWHDRAVFHFLTDPADRTLYARQAAHALAAGGGLVIATFADDGPAKCSGLDVMRYSPEALMQALSERFTLEYSRREVHHTPAGVEQRFLHCLLRLR